MIYVENKQQIKVKTDSGFENFNGITKNKKQTIYQLVLENGFSIKCTRQHKFITWTNKEKTLKELKIGNIIQTNDGVSRIKEIIKLKEKEEVYDLIDVENHKFFANNILTHNCELLSAEATLIDTRVLQRIKPINEKYFFNNIRWYDDIDCNKLYLVALDPAMGTNNDYSAIEVFSLPDLVQVAEWRSTKADAIEQVKILQYILEYIDSYVGGGSNTQLYYTIENNAVGWAPITTLYNNGEENFKGILINEPRAPGKGLKKKGLTTTHKTKLHSCAKLKQFIEKGTMTIKSKALLSELKNFIRSGESAVEKYSAKAGYNDDLVSATLLCIRIMQIISTYNEQVMSTLDEQITFDEPIEPAAMLF